VQLRSDLTRNERTAFAAVSAIKSFDEKIEKIDLATAEKLLNEFKGSKPIQPRLDQISKDLGDVTWSFRVLPNEIEQTISLVARYNRQLSLVPFSKIMAVCVTPLRQPADLANAPSKDNIENAVMRNLTMIGMGWLMFSSTRHSQRFPGIHPLQKRRSSEEWWLVLFQINAANTLYLFRSSFDIWPCQGTIRK